MGRKSNSLDYIPVHRKPTFKQSTSSLSRKVERKAKQKGALSAQQQQQQAATTSSSYTYTPLGKNEIRLVKIRPCSPSNSSSQIECTIQHAILEGRRPPRYIALSYVWGSAIDQPEIGLNGSLFRITRNLEAALRGLRDDRVGFTNTYLWIDAICIDQTNGVEKAQQVARMAEIYANAEDVTCWLSPWDCPRMHDVGEVPVIPGKNIDTVRDRCSMCQLLAGLQNLALASHVSHVPPLDVDCLTRIVQSPWFTRVWTLQECTIHLRGVIQLGCHSMPINLFLDGAFKAWDALDLPQLPGYRALESMASIRYQRAQLGRGKINGNDYAETIMMLLQASSNRSCSIPQDILYGVFGLMESFQQSPNNLRPNYAKTFERVCHDYAVEIFTHSPYGLELLSFARNELQGDVPSWVPDFRYIGDLDLSLQDQDGLARLSSNNRQLLFEGANVGHCVSSLGAMLQPQDPDLSPLDRVAKRIVDFETKILFPAADISNRGLEELLVNFLASHLSIGSDLEGCIKTWLTLASWPSAWSSRVAQCKSVAELQTLRLTTGSYEPAYQTLLTFLSSGFLVLDSGVIGITNNRSAQVLPDDIACYCRRTDGVFILRSRPGTVSILQASDMRSESTETFKFLSAAAFGMDFWESRGAAKPDADGVYHYSEHPTKTFVIV